jgi:hypothetical protein
MKPKPLSVPSKEMVNATQRLQFVVRFVQLDLDTLRPGDWLNLQWELRDFLLPTHQDLGVRGLHTFPVDPPVPEEYSRADFRALQAEARELLAMVIDSRDDARIWRRIPIDHIRIAAPHVLGPPDRKQGRHFLCVQGPTRDMFLLRLLFLLCELNTAVLLRCPECNTIFLRKRNQEYCSRTCVNRVSQRRWRERQDAAATPAPLLP